MFSKLSDKLQQTIHSMRGLGQITEENIKSSLKEVRLALLDADVALEVVKDFIAKVEEQALGEKVHHHLKPGEALVKIVNDELTHILGDENEELDLKSQPPVVIMMAGLQGSGKTTTVAKLASWLQDTQDKKVMVTSADIYRPAAIKQLQSLAEQVKCMFHPSSTDQSPQVIASEAYAAAKKEFADVLIVDTAGRLHIDTELMDELKQLQDKLNPQETLFVCDSMTGQDAAKVAKQFHETITLTGIVLTKTDGDARGGAALSMRMITGCPIKFIGVGEKIDNLEAFHPKRMASRILGMGDILSIVEEAERKLDKKEAKKLAQKVKKGKKFDFNDFLQQLQQMKKMGGLNKLMSKMPSMPQVSNNAMKKFDDAQVKKMQAIIFSMTPQERTYPAVINGSRKKRLASGSGTNLQEVNKLLKQFQQMQKMMKRVTGQKFGKRLKHMQGQIPPEMRDQLPDDLF